MSKKENKGFSALQVCLIILLSPFILIYAAVVLTNQFIIRGFQYAALAIKDWFSTEKEIPYIEPINRLNPEILPLPKSLEPLDLAVNLDKNKEQNVKQQSSFVKIAGLLDLTTPDLAKAQERAANNDEFKRARKNSLSSFVPMENEPGKEYETSLSMGTSF